MKQYMSQDEIRREAEKRGLKPDGNGGYYKEGSWSTGFRQDTDKGTVSSGPNGSPYRAYGHNIIDKLDKAAGNK
jgi:hypothetical protein